MANDKDRETNSDEGFLAQVCYCLFRGVGLCTILTIIIQKLLLYLPGGAIKIFP